MENQGRSTFNWLNIVNIIQIIIKKYSNNSRKANIKLTNIKKVLMINL